MEGLCAVVVTVGNVEKNKSEALTVNDFFYWSSFFILLALLTLQELRS